MVIKKTIILMVLLCSCGNEKDEGSSSSECKERKVAIDEAVVKVNHCEKNSDCRVKGINPHYGCYLTYNKNEDITGILDSIDSYSSSSCWDGMTTLTTLDCGPASESSLTCVENKCQNIL